MPKSPESQTNGERLVAKISEELKGILDVREFECENYDELLDIHLAVLPPSDQERIRENLTQESPGLRPIAVSVATQQTFIETYEALQKSARQRIKEYCEQCVRDASERPVETKWLKEYVQQLVKWNFLASDHPAVAETTGYSDTESPATLYSLLLRLFSQKEWFPATRYAGIAGRFFCEAELLQRLATAVGECLSETIEKDSPEHSQQSLTVRWYASVFGPHVSFRIKDAFVHEKYAEIFKVLGHDFVFFMAWAGLVGEEKKKRIAELFGRVFRYHCWRRSPSGWKALRDLVSEFGRWKVSSYADLLLGAEKGKLLREWIDPAEKAAKPDCSQEAMEELLQEIETVSAKPIEFSRLMESFVEALGEEYFDPYIFDLQYGSQSPLRYYPTILFQERMEEAIGGRWEKWRRIDRHWKLRAIGRALRSTL